MKLSPWPWLVVGLMCAIGNMILKFHNEPESDPLFIIQTICVAMFLSIMFGRRSE